MIEIGGIWLLGCCVTVVIGAKEIASIKNPVIIGIVITLSFFLWPFIAVSEAVMVIRKKSSEDDPDEEDNEDKW